MLTIQIGAVNYNTVKVLLINPTDYQTMFVEPPVFFRLTDSTIHFPPLGLLYIAANLMSYTDAEVAILDAQLEGLTYDAIEERIRAYKPDLVGISAYTLTLLDTIEIAHRVKLVNTETFVVIGGPHAFIYPDQTAMLPYIDAVVPGEGEEVMTDIVKNIVNKSSLKDIPGLYFKDKGELVFTSIRSPIRDLDHLPFPARKLLPIHAYKFVADLSRSSTLMISSRGCRFKCTFCDIPFRSIRSRSPRNVAMEISECFEMGYKDINFYDDNFNFSEERVGDICKEIINRDIPVRFSIRARVDKINPPMLHLLYRAGCRRISFGIEAGDDETLKYLKKGITIDMVRKAIKLTKDAGIEVSASFILAIPSRPKEISLRTINFAIELDPDYAIFVPMILLPATNIYTEALNSNAIERDFYLDFAKHPIPMPNKAYWENPLSYEEAQSLTKLAHKRFYLRPTYMWKQLRKVSSLTEFLKKGHAALDILFYTLFNK